MFGLYLGILESLKVIQHMVGHNRKFVDSQQDWKLNLFGALYIL